LDKCGCFTDQGSVSLGGTTSLTPGGGAPERRCGWRAQASVVRIFAPVARWLLAVVVDADCEFDGRIRSFRFDQVSRCRCRRTSFGRSLTTRCSGASSASARGTGADDRRKCPCLPPHRNNSAYVGFIITGACVGTYVVDGVFDSIWAVANKGVRILSCASVRCIVLCFPFALFAPFPFRRALRLTCCAEAFPGHQNPPSGGMNKCQLLSRNFLGSNGACVQAFVR
jgi:hypothetical protein